MARFFQSAVKNTIIFSTALFSAFTFAQGKLAIVIDDIGYHPKEDAEVLAMPKEISVAIIPAAPYAKFSCRTYFSSACKVVLWFGPNWRLCWAMTHSLELECALSL